MVDFICSFISNCSCYILYFWCPSCKSPSSLSRIIWFFNIISWSSIIICCSRLQYSFSIFIYKCYCILICCIIKFCCISSFSCYYWKSLLWSISCCSVIPSSKCIWIFCCSWFSWCLSCIRWSCSINHFTWL